MDVELLMAAIRGGATTLDLQGGLPLNKTHESNVAPGAMLATVLSIAVTTKGHSQWRPNLPATSS